VNRVAIVTDLHANLPALEAMLTRTDELEAKAVYCGGDLVGYGPHPNDVCQLIEERAIATIYGNYDYAVARDLDDCGCFYPTPNDREIGQRSVAWTLEHSDERSKRFMRDLPFDLRFELAGKRLRLVHGSPRKVNEYLLEDRVRRRPLRQLRLGRQAEGQRPARKLRRPDRERRPHICLDRADRVRRQSRGGRDSERRASAQARRAALGGRLGSSHDASPARAGRGAAMRL
jgi:predicted phosphodiesterase